MQLCSTSFKSNIWKLRNEKWKALRDELNITKKSFKDYRKNFINERRNIGTSSVPNSSNRQHDREYGYINPFNDFRNFKLDKEFLFILFSSSNFLHSGSFFSHLECNDFLDYSSPVCSFDYNIYDV
ncbi:unnamed protein product [Rhizophagus irregularis]|nr:unnamed protein product [Rhizophagus irregularis]